MQHLKIRYLIYGILVIVGCLVVLTAVRYQQTGSSRPVEKTGFAMGTVISQKLYGADSSDMDNILGIVKELDTQMLSWREEGSELAKLNRDHTRKLTGAFAGYIKNSFSLANASHGAFDPTLRPLISLWGIEGDEPRVPDQYEIDVCQKQIGYEKVTLTDADITLHEDMALDLGAVGKGIALDEVYQYLDAHAVRAAVIAVGGSVLIYGDKPDGNFKIAIRDPDSENGAAMGVLSLSGTHYISTSGDYEQYFEENGVRYHHILDRRTGFPARSGLRSVTIVCNNGLYSDGLSTACFVLGYEDSRNLLKEYHAEAIFIDDTGNVIVTEGLRNAFQINNTAYKIKDMNQDETENEKS